MTVPLVIPENVTNPVVIPGRTRGPAIGLTTGIANPIFPFMLTATLDEAGRVVIPKPLRDELGLSAGDRLTVECDGQRVIVQPVRSAAAMRKENGVWVFRSGEAVSAAESEHALREMRRRRDRSAHGSGI